MVQTKLFNRLGSKTNDIKYFAQYLQKKENGIKKIVEPFGGSFALTIKEYPYPEYERHVNDTDNNLYYVYTHQDEYIEMLNKIKEKEPEVGKFSMAKYLKDNPEFTSPFYDYIMSWMIVRGSMYKNKNTQDINMNDTKNIIFTNEDYKIILDKFKKDKTAFLFLDPPYLFSDNSTYQEQEQEQNMDMTDILVYLSEFMKDKKTKCKCLLIINKLKIIEYLFKGLVKGEYTKIYQMGKKKMQHLIICNY